MAYCTTTDVNSEFKETTFTDSTPITLTEIGGWIDQAEAKIDSYLNNRYETPITGTEALLVVKDICLLLVVAKIKPKIKLGGGTKQKSQLEESKELRRIAIDQLKDLNKGNTVLSDATPKTPFGKSHAQTEDREPIFEIDKEYY